MKWLQCGYTERTEHTMTAAEVLNKILAHRDRYNTSLPTAANAFDMHAVHALSEADYWLLQDTICDLASLELTETAERVVV